VAIAIGAACAAALAVGIRTTADLSWAPGPDTMRDVASAETILQGDPLSDPHYRGEWIWYNPLVPAIVAASAALGGQATHVLFARLGAYLNLAAPLALSLLVWRLFDRWTALAALIGFLFLLPGKESAWMAASYSPWLLPMHFVQSLFYVALLQLWRSSTSRRPRDWAVAGLTCGLVLLGHTAPAVILIGTATVLVAFDARLDRQSSFRRHLSNWLLFGLGVTLVGLPLLISIVGHYWLVIRNPGPSGWVAPGLEHSQLTGALFETLRPTIPGVFALTGILFLLRARRSASARVVLVSALTTAALFSYGYLAQWAGAAGLALPTPVPHFHFLFYLRAFEAMAFGLGVARLAELGPERLRSSLLIATLAASTWLSWPAYRSRPDFTLERDFARQLFASRELVDMFDWIRTNTSPGDVILAREDLSLAVIGTAGRKVVAVDRLFSNPFVDWETRVRDRDRMFDALDRGDAAELMRVASQYRVRYAVRDTPLAATDALRCCATVVWSAGSWHIYRIGSL